MHKFFIDNIGILIRFSVVGGIGSVVNISIYMFLTVTYGNDINVSAILAFLVAVVNNYFLNHYWSFSVVLNGVKASIKKLLHYMFFNIIGLSINLFVLNVIVYLFGMTYHVYAQLIGILLGMSSNFFFSKTVVFQDSSNSLIDK